MRKAALFLLFFYVQLVKSQNLLPATEVRTDLDSLVTLLENIHPDPYSAFGGRMNFYKEYQRIRSSIPGNGLSKDESYFLFSRFISNLHDGHTYLSFPTTDQVGLNKYFSPVSWGIASDGLFVTKTSAEYKELTGYRLLKIDTVSIDSLIKKISQIQPCENKYGAYSNLVGFLNDGMLLKRLISFRNNSVALSLQTTDGNIVDRTITYSEKQEWQKQYDSTGLFHYQYLDKNHKVMRFNFRTAFGREVLEQMQAQKMNYRSMLKMLYGKYYPTQTMPVNDADAIAGLPSLSETFWKMLHEMKKNKSTHLIIDLRENNGGWTSSTFPTLYMLFGDQYFSHDFKIEYNKRLSAEFLSKFNMNMEEYNKNNKTSYRTGDYQFGYFTSFDSSKTAAERREIYIRSLTKYNINEGVLLEKMGGQPLYSPKIIILTSPSTFSAAFHYAFFLKELSGAPIVGVCSRQAGNTGMETLNIELPHTRLAGSISCSMQLFFPNDKSAGKSLEPDLPISWNVWHHYSFDTNTPLLYVLDKIESGEL